MCDPCCGPCDPCYPCYPCRPCKSRELRGGNLIMSCECLKRNGLQHDCPRWECQAKPCCLTKPEATCCPSRWARRYRFLTMGRKSKFDCPALKTVSTAGGGCNPCTVGPCSSPCDPCCLPAVCSPAACYDSCCVPVCKPICCFLP
ncbi:keratin-associated protein 5-4-like [Anopheles cruzii]|uniref:keratin-associated protein 5-4-like n=1 Tax=Anopheles cruzii TaxID=68878 RepID=UPI0022EC70AB|nr:keratin-associated protein 5-4-like [Anopheles cruzii]